MTSLPTESSPGRNRAAGVLVALVVGLGTAAWWNNDSTRCASAVAAKDWSALDRAATDWLNREPTNGDAWLYLAQAAERQGDEAKVVACLSKVPHTHPRAAEALERQIELALGPLNRPLDASLALERLLELRPEDPEVHERLIRFYAQTYQRLRLLQQVRESIAAGAESRAAYLHLITADERWLPLQREIYEQWRDAHPDCPVFVAAHALCQAEGPPVADSPSDYAHPSDYSTASPGDADLEELWRRFPDQLELLAEQFERSIARDDIDRVRSLMDIAPGRARQDDRFWRYAAWCFDRSGDPAQAEAACRRALEINPLSWKARAQLAEMLSHRDAPPRDVEELHQLAEIGQSLDRDVRRILNVEAPAQELLLRLADYASACGDDLVARGLARHLRPPQQKP